MKQTAFCLERLQALMCAAFAVRKGHAGTHDFFFGWLYGLAEADALDPATLLAAQQFVARRGYAQSAGATLLYGYPSPSAVRVEGKSLFELEQAIRAGGPHREVHVRRIHTLAQDSAHALHFVARHYLFLSRARNQNFSVGQFHELPPQAA